MTKKVKKSTTNKAKSGKVLSFEKALERLEVIVDQLESADAPLDKALAYYEEGIGLARTCSTQLKAAERKVELLEEKGSQLRSRPFENESNEPNASNVEEDEDGGDDEGEENDEETTEEEGESEEDDDDQETLF